MKHWICHSTRDPGCHWIFKEDGTLTWNNTNTDVETEIGKWKVVDGVVFTHDSRFQSPEHYTRSLSFIQEAYDEHVERLATELNHLIVEDDGVA